MKKLIAIFLILFTLLLTACNNQTTETSTSTNKTEKTETTTTTQTSETTFSTQESQSSETTTEKTETTEVPQGYEIPAGLQNILVGVQQLNLFAELPSRILFSHSLDKGKWIGDRYQYNGGEYTVDANVYHAVRCKWFTNGNLVCTVGVLARPMNGVLAYLLCGSSYSNVPADLYIQFSRNK